MGWLITAGVLAVLAILPLGVGGAYEQAGYLLYFRIGPFKVKLLPRRPKEKKQKEKHTQAKTASQKTEKKKTVQKQGSLQDFLPLLRLVLDFLGNTRQKMRINQLEAKITLAGDDPADLAIAYGNAWITAGNLLVQLERLFVIKKRNVEVLCDFTADKTLLFIRLDATITLGRLLYLQMRYGIPVVREYLKIMNQRKGGATI